MRQEATSRGHQPVPIQPVFPSGYPVDMRTADLRTAREHYRHYGCPVAYARWNELSIQADKAAKTIEEVSIAYFNAPEDSEVCQSLFERFDRLSVEQVKAAIGPQELCRLKRQLERSLIASGGVAEKLLIERLSRYRRLY